MAKIDSFDMGNIKVYYVPCTAVYTGDTERQNATYFARTIYGVTYDCVSLGSVPQNKDDAVNIYEFEETVTDSGVLATVMFSDGTTPKDYFWD